MCISLVRLDGKKAENEEYFVWFDTATSVDGLLNASL